MTNQQIAADREWYEKDKAAWRIAADDLINHGYRQVGPDESSETYYTHDVGLPDVRLVRNLGRLNWHPVKK